MASADLGTSSRGPRRDRATSPYVAGAALLAATLAMLASLLTGPAGPTSPTDGARIDRHHVVAGLPPFEARALGRATGVASLLGLGALLLIGGRAGNNLRRRGRRLLDDVAIHAGRLCAAHIHARGPPVPSLV